MGNEWNKLGKIYCPDGTKEWMRSHCANTVTRHLGDDAFRVYFSSRDSKNRSHISYIDMKYENGAFTVFNECKKPVLSPGGPGYFDESGVSLACIVERDGREFVYYLGWTLGATVPWYNSIGVAELSKDGETAVKLYKAPIYSRSEYDPISLSYPFLHPTEKGYNIYYGTNKSWGKEKETMDHVIMLAYSEDGINFQPTGRNIIEPVDKTEYAFSRPYVFVENDVWKMYYSFRGEKYRIGYAESTDGINWKRNDKDVGISVSEDGWDSEMICYPCLFSHDDKLFMTYNGNDYGRNGFGIAVRN